MRKKLDNISHGKPSAEQSSLKASQSSNGTKIRTDIEETKEKLSALAEKWKGVNSVKGFLTDLWIALGISIPSQGQHKGGNPSRYTAFKLKDGSVITVTIRASAHNADAANYSKEENVNGDRNLSLVLQKRWKKNKFKSSINVKLDEYVYVDSNIANIENPLTQIATALIGYLTNGIYVDTTGVAIVHKSPTTIKELNTRKIMNTNKIKLTESQLKQMISETVKKVLNEDHRQLNPNLPTMSEVISKIDKIADELSKLAQHDLAYAIMNEYDKGSDEYKRGMEARKKLLGLDVKGLLWDFLPHHGVDYEQIGY